MAQADCDNSYYYCDPRYYVQDEEEKAEDEIIDKMVDEKLRRKAKMESCKRIFMEHDLMELIYQKWTHNKKKKLRMWMRDYLWPDDEDYTKTDPIFYVDIMKGKYPLKMFFGDWITESEWYQFLNWYDL